tara:strand:+ start:652 stop:795 length:144 start_codon:yes stop_codon:yes gene_type:complete
MLLHFDRPFLRVVIYSQQKQSKERDQARVILKKRERKKTPRGPFSET